MLEFLRYLVEKFHFLMRHDRDRQLGQHVDRITRELFYPTSKTAKRAAAIVQRARKYLALMVDKDHRERHEATIIRTGH